MAVQGAPSSCSNLTTTETTIKWIHRRKVIRINKQGFVTARFLERFERFLLVFVSAR